MSLPRLWDCADAPRSLIWLEEFGFGYYPVDQSAAPYDEAYFAKYEGYAKTTMGFALSIARTRLIERHWPCGPVVDVGIGCGDFVERRPNTFGYDINPAAVRWLLQHDRYWNPRIDPCQAVSMWDVLEHMPDFPDLLLNVQFRAFVALPVFENLDHVLRSRHFRPDEHCWYFTVDGFVRAMNELGWWKLETNWIETVLGRDHIASFAFRRA